MNIKNDEIVTQTGNIMWKWISSNEIIDQELAKWFADNKGQDCVIEIILSKDCKGPSLISFIKILNGLVQIPQLIAKLWESGLAKTIQVINELFPDNIEVISTNFDTLKKISNQKKGREYIIKNGLVEGILKNIRTCAQRKNAKVALSGLTVIDNLSRSDEGKDAIKAANGIDCLSYVLDSFENNEQILKICGKIYGKLASKEDMLEEIKKLQKYYETITKEGCDKLSLKDLNKTLVLISNFMWVDDISKMLQENENFTLLQNLFLEISKVSLDDKNIEFSQTYIGINKYFSIIFSRIFQSKPEIYDSSSAFGKDKQDLIQKIEGSINKINEYSEKNKSNEEWMLAFMSYFNSYNDILYQHYKKLKESNDNSQYIQQILYIINEVIAKKDQEIIKDTRVNYISSRVLKIANEFSKKASSVQNDLIKALVSTFSFMNNTVAKSEDEKTLNNIMDILYDLLQSQSEFKTKHYDDIIINITDLMLHKSQFRYAHSITLKILNGYLTNEYVTQYKQNNDPNANRTHSIQYVTCVVNVTSYICENKNDEIEEFILNLGAEILSKLIEPSEFRGIVDEFKKLSERCKCDGSNLEDERAMEKKLLMLTSWLYIHGFYKEYVNELWELLKPLLNKEVTFIESYKKDKEAIKKDNYKDTLNRQSKRIGIELNIAVLISNLSIIHSQGQTDEYKYIVKAFEIIFSFLGKSTDWTNIRTILKKWGNKSSFILNNENTLKTERNEKVTEKVTNVLNILLRRLIEEDNILYCITETIIPFAEQKVELCNILVKGGCPRLLLQIAETSSDVKSVESALKLFHIITVSNTENLTMIANQNVLLKFIELRQKFAGNQTVTRYCDLISNEILKLPGQEKYAEEVLTESIAEFNENAKGEFNPPQKTKIWNNLEVINAFSSGEKLIELLRRNTLYLKNLLSVFEKTLSEEEINQINEQLLTNEMTSLHKIRMGSGSNIDLQDENEAIIIKIILEIIKKKSMYRNIFLAGTSFFSQYLKNEEYYNKHIASKIDTAFIDTLFEISENYLDDPKVSKEINNILCLLCLRNEKFADYIKQRGGLSNVLEEIKANVSNNDENSKILKLNAMKMLQSLCLDEKGMNLFIKANGVDIINSIIKNELSLIDDKTKESLYSTNNVIKFKSMSEHVEIGSANANQNDYFVYCLQIIKNGLDKGHKAFAEEALLSNLIKITNARYPNHLIFQEICSIFDREGVSLPQNEHDNFLVIKIALSLQAEYYYNDELNKKMKKLLCEKSIHNIKKNSEAYIKGFLQDINSNISNKEESGLNERNRIITYISLFIDISADYEQIYSSNNDVIKAVLELYNWLFDYYDKNKTTDIKGIIISLIRVYNILLKNKQITNDSYVDKYLEMSEEYMSSENALFMLEFLCQYKIMFDALGESNKHYIVYLKNISKKSVKIYKAFNKAITKKNELDTTTNVLLKLTKEINKLNIKYYNKEIDLDDKAKMLSKVLREVFNWINNLLNCSNISADELESEVLVLWDLLKALLLASSKVNKEEMSKIWTEETIYKLFDTYKNIIKELPKIKEQASIQELINLLSKFIDNNNNNLFDSLIEWISEDLSAAQNVKVDLCLESLVSLSKFSVVCKLIVKNAKLFQAIQKIYNEKDLTLKNRRNIDIILNNIMKNSYNIDDLLQTSPDIFHFMGLKITDSKNLIKDKENIDIPINEFDTLLMILKDNNNYKMITEKKLITDTDLQMGISNYKDVNEDLGQRLVALHKIIEDYRNAKKEYANIKIDQEILDKLTRRIEGAFNEHMELLVKQNPNLDESEETADTKTEKPLEQSTSSEAEKPKSKPKLAKKMSLMVTPASAAQKSSSMNKGRMSIISKNVFYNNYNAEVASPISTKLQQDISNALDSLFSLIRLLYNNNKSCTDDELKKTRINMLIEATRLLKMLSICPDNHKTILDIGLLDFMERIISDKAANIALYIPCLDILKNCTWSEGAVMSFLETPLFDNLLDDAIQLYYHPEELLKNNETKTLFLYYNINISNTCKCKKGFDMIFKKIGIDKLRSLGVMTGNVDFLNSIVQMIINYFENSSIRGDDEVDNKDEAFYRDLLQICNKGLTMPEKTPALFINSLKWLVIIYSEKTKEPILKAGIVKKVIDEYEFCKNEPNFLMVIMQILGLVEIEDPKISTEVMDSKLLDKIMTMLKEQPDLINNAKLVEALSIWYKNLVVKNEDNCTKMCSEIKHLELILYFIDMYSKMAMKSYINHSNSRKDKNLIKVQLSAKSAKSDLGIIPGEAEAQSCTDTLLYNDVPVEAIIVLNFVKAFDCITAKDNSVEALTKTKFVSQLLASLKCLNENSEIVALTLQCLGNFFYKDTSKYWKHSEIEQLYHILKELQKNFYTNSAILTNINYISGYILKGFNSKIYTQKFYLLIVNGLNCQDWNISLVSLSLQILRKSLIQHEDLQTDVFEPTSLSVLNLLRIYANNHEIQSLCYNALSPFAKNSVLSYFIINGDTLPIIRETLNNTEFNFNAENRLIVRKSVMELLADLSSDDSNSKQVSKELMDIFIRDLTAELYTKDMIYIGRWLAKLLKHKSCIDIFENLLGLTSLYDSLNAHSANIEYMLSLFKVVSVLAYNSEEQKGKLITMKYVELIKEILYKNNTNKKMLFEGKILLCLINLKKGEKNIKAYKEVKYEELNKEKNVKETVMPFLTTGKVVKIITPKGKEKEMLLCFSPDLMMVHCKKNKINLPPKQKYTIETPEIANVIKGHGSPQFKKAMGVFKASPKAENCFSIIGPASSNGDKSINVVCAGDKEVALWVDNVQQAVEYIKNKLKTA